MKEQTMVSMFLKSAGRFPHDIAAEDRHGAYTFEQLERLTAAVAHAVLHTALKLGADLRKDIAAGKNGQRIVIMLPRCRAYIAAALGIQRAGCAFITIDPEYPEERIRMILSDSESRIVLTVKDLADRPCFNGMEVILMESIAEGPFCEKKLNLSRPGNEGFITYTSGSTGKPKGVILRQVYFNSFMKGTWSVLPMNSRIRCANMSGFTFVASILDLYAGVVTGGSVYILDEKERLDLRTICETIRHKKINFMFAPPKFARILLKYDPNLPLDVLISGGEKFTQVPECSVRLIEGLGATEMGLPLMHEVKHGEDDSLLGYPQPGYTVYLLDEGGKCITEPDVIGEACYVSHYLAIQYSNLPEETAAKFTPCPFRPEERMYRSGDLMSWTADGQLRSHGRKDNMVKLDGFRIELGEVENVCRRVPGVQDAACVVKPVMDVDKLFCYYMATEGAAVDADLLKEQAQRFLPAYMVPSVFEALEAMPLNKNGKLDRPRLLALEYTPEAGEYEAPATALEEALCAAFAQVLKLPRVGATDNFFDLGGNSMSTAQLIPAIRELGWTLSYQDVYQNNTPRALAAFLDGKAGTDDSWTRMDRERYPLTKTQLGIYLEGAMSELQTTYTVSYLMKAETGVTSGQLADALKTLLAAHPGMLYAVIPDEENQPWMVMREDRLPEIRVARGSEKKLQEFLQASIHPIRFGDRLLLEIAIYETPEHCYMLWLSHLMLLDGTSIKLLIDEMNRALKGEKLLGEDYNIQQAAMLEEKKMHDGSYDRAKRYYAEMLKDLPGTEHLAGDLEGRLDPGISRNFRYDPHTLSGERVRSFCRKLGITEPGFFLGAMAITMGKYLRSEQVTFSTVYNGRADAGFENTIGTLIKRIPIYGELNGSQPVSNFLQAMGRQVFGALANSVYSFDEVLKAFPISEDVEFIYQGDTFMDAKEQGRLLSGDDSNLHNYHTGMVTGLMSIQLFLNDGFFNMTVEYRNQRFTEAWIANFSENFFAVAESVMQAATIADVQMMPAGMAEKMAAFNDTAIDIGFMPIGQQVQRQAQEHPDRMAVIAAGQKLSFCELTALADRLGERLIQMGVRRNDLVGVMLDRSVFAYVAELAILKAGGAFLPLVPEYPDDRIEYCLQDSGTRILITRESLCANHPLLLSAQETFTVLTLETAFGPDDLGRPSELAAQTAAAGQKEISVSVGPDDLAYCIYTSGSTGRPKGVLIEQHNIANYVHRNEKSVEIMHYARPGRISLALASLSFDVSVVEQFVPLCNGNTTVLATDEEIHDPELLAKLILETGASGMTCTPSMLINLLEIPAFRPALEQLDFFDIGSEAFQPKLYDRLREIRDDSVILNVYGPTECTMGCSAAVMSRSEAITVGGPIANTRFYVADRYGNPLPVGVRGELIICGDGVGRGYVNLPEKTAAAFFRHKGLRAYHSGDLAEWTAEGEIRIVGRIDNQIKLRGFRIELDEIENAMAGYPGIGICAVKVYKSGGEFLVGYYTASGKIDPEDVLEYLRGMLAEYMVPSILQQLPDMPLTTNGKVDRKALPDPDISVLTVEYVAPRTEMEKSVCEAFEKVLNLERGSIGVLDEFSTAGGNSLSAMRLASVLKDKGLSVVDIFTGKTPEGIAAILTARGAEDAGASAAQLREQEQAARAGRHKLTAQQMVMVDYQFCNPSSRMFHLGGLIRFGPSVEPQRLCSAYNRLLRNHPTLSSMLEYDLHDGEIYQRYVPGLLPEVKLEWMSEIQLAELAEKLSVPFRLIGGPLLNTRMFRTPNYCYIFIDMHHVVGDGTSIAVILDELKKAYDGQELEEDHYFLWLQRRDERELAAKNSAPASPEKEAFEPKVRIPSPDDPLHDSLTAGTLEALTWVDVQRMEAAEIRFGESRNVIAITAALLALGEMEDESSVGVDWLYHNRTETIYSSSVGNMITDLSVGLNLKQFPDPKSLVREVARQVGVGIAHVEDVEEEPQMSPFLNDALEVNYLYGLGDDDDDFGGLDATLLELPTPLAVANNMMALYLSETPKGIRIRLEFIASRYRRETAERFFKLYQHHFTHLVLDEA